MTGNRNRIAAHPLGALPMYEMLRRNLPHHLRDRPVCEIERGTDRGWLIRTHSGAWAMLTPVGSIQTLPQHKIGPALATAGIEADG